MHSLLFLAVFGSPTVVLAAEPPKIEIRDLFDSHAEAIHASDDRRDVRRATLEDHPRFRPANFDVLSYDLDVTVEPSTGLVTGSAVIHFKSLSTELRTIVLDAVAMQIEGASEASGRLLLYRYDGELLTVDLDEPLARGETGVVRVAYKALTPESLLLTGPDATHPTRMAAAYTYTEPEDSRLWFPCLDRPSDKATLTIGVRVPEGFNALSNGIPVATETRGPWNVFRYRMDHPIATYLVSLAIGAYDVLPIGDFNGKPLTLWTPPDVREAAINETARTRRMMEVFSEFTGVEYPFASYAQSVAQAYGASMEHQSATTMGGKRIVGDGSGEGVVAHELAHQWFGDWVTCRTWGELWLNEGFASYLPHVFFHAENEEARALSQLDYWRFGYFEEAKTRVHPLSAPNPDMTDLFDSHAYEKGALVLNHLRDVANRLPLGTAGKAGSGETFTAALSRYLDASASATVTNHELQSAFDAVTGQSFQEFFDQWVRSPGHPILEAHVETADGATWLVVEQKQKTRAENPWRAFTFPLTVEMIDADGVVTTTDLDIYDDVQRLRLPVSRAGLVGLSLDPKWNLPAEISLTQSEDGWLKILSASTYTTSRLAAARALLRLGNGSLSDTALALVRADASHYLKASVMATLSEKSENRSQVLQLYRDLSVAPSLDIGTKGAVARAEEWLVKTLGRIPTRAEEREWQERFTVNGALGVQAERSALLGMLTHASLERAQAFALDRLAEPHWVTRDRTSLIDVLTKSPTATSLPFITDMLQRGSYVFLHQTLSNLTKASYDQPALYESLARNARGHRHTDIRAATVGLMAKQTSSRDLACVDLSELSRAGLDGEHPEWLQSVREAATSALQDLGCAP